MARRHAFGLLLTTEESWPAAFEAIFGRLGRGRYRGEAHDFACERRANVA